MRIKNAHCKPCDLWFADDEIIEYTQDGAWAFRRMSSAIYDESQAMQKLTISYPVVKREAHFRSIWGADED